MNRYFRSFNDGWIERFRTLNGVNWGFFAVNQANTIRNKSYPQRSNATQPLNMRYINICHHLPYCDIQFPCTVVKSVTIPQWTSSIPYTIISKRTKPTVLVFNSAHCRLRGPGWRRTRTGDGIVISIAHQLILPFWWRSGGWSLGREFCWWKTRSPSFISSVKPKGST